MPRTTRAFRLQKAKQHVQSRRETNDQHPLVLPTLADTLQNAQTKKKKTFPFLRIGSKKSPVRQLDQRSVSSNNKKENVPTTPESKDKVGSSPNSFVKAGHNPIDEDWRELLDMQPRSEAARKELQEQVQKLLNSSDTPLEENHASPVDYNSFVRNPPMKQNVHEDVPSGSYHVPFSPTLSELEGKEWQPRSLGTESDSFTHMHPPVKASLPPKRAHPVNYEHLFQLATEEKKSYSTRSVSPPSNTVDDMYTPAAPNPISPPEAINESFSRVSTSSESCGECWQPQKSLSDTSLEVDDPRDYIAAKLVQKQSKPTLSTIIPNSESVRRQRQKQREKIRRRTDPDGWVSSEIWKEPDYVQDTRSSPRPQGERLLDPAGTYEPTRNEEIAIPLKPGEILI